MSQEETYNLHLNVNDACPRCRGKLYHEDEVGVFSGRDLVCLMCGFRFDPFAVVLTKVTRRQPASHGGMLLD